MPPRLPPAAADWIARDGAHFLIRPISADDEPLLVSFHATLSADTVYARYFEPLGLPTRTAHERLAKVVSSDHGLETVLVAEQVDDRGERRITAVARLSRSPDVPEAEFAILVGDPWQGRGLGEELLRRLVRLGHDAGLRLIWADMLASNYRMRRTAQAVGFTLFDRPTETTTRAELHLR